MGITLSDITSSAPLVALLSFSFLTLIVESWGKDKPVSSFWVGLAGAAISLGLSFFNLGTSTAAYGGMLSTGGFAGYCNVIFLSSALLTILLSRSYLERMQCHRGEFYILILFATTGMMLMAGALNLSTVFLGIELMSVALYVLAGFMRTKVRSNESALKYFLLGAFATGFLLYGIALIYGTSGTTDLVAISKVFPELVHNPVFLMGCGLLIVALSFKVAAVPFHMWAPDVYEGAPTPVSGFMSTGAKSAAFATFLLVFIRVFDIAGSSMSQVLAVIAAFSMIVGNITAIAQNNVKRMLAYSSIAHAGYMLSGIAAANVDAETGILFYLLAYTFVNVGAFGVVSMMERQDDAKLTFDDYAGLSARRPMLALVMSMFMFSLAGIPPFAGFFGKYYVFLAAVKANMTWLAILGVLTSLVSVYYYLRLVVLMYFREGEADLDHSIPLTSVIALAIAGAVIVIVGIYPSLIVDVTRSFFKI
jgi:NADH-quinone oxidoreductase subunit N